MLDKLTADILPDSRSAPRSKGRVGGVQSAVGTWIPIYCGSCGVEGGRVLECAKAMEGFAFWLCHPCFAKYGDLTAVHIMPDERFWELVKQEQLEGYGRELTAAELSSVVAADASRLATLIKEGCTTPGG